MDIHDHWTIRSASEDDIASVLDLWPEAGSIPSVSDSPDGLARLLAVDPQQLPCVCVDGREGVGALVDIRSDHDHLARPSIDGFR